MNVHAFRSAIYPSAQRLLFENECLQSHILIRSKEELNGSRCAKMLQTPGPFLQFFRRSFGGHDLTTIYSPFYPVKKVELSATGSGLYDYDMCLLAACHLSLVSWCAFIGWLAVIELAFN
jgi:hypothetical protein